jgi:hypothetical protein
METIIAGSRHITDPDIVADAIRDSGFPVTDVISGGAPGVDTLGEQWAEQHGIPVVRFPADWKTLGRRAGSIRNQEMAGYAEGLVAIWDGKSRGSRNMIQLARRRGLQVFVYRVDHASEAIEAREMQQGLCVGMA